MLFITTATNSDLCEKKKHVKNVQKWQKKTTTFFHITFMVSHNLFPSIKTMLKVYILDNGSPKSEIHMTQTVAHFKLQKS